MNKPRDCKKFIEMMEKSGIILIKRYHNKKLRYMLFEVYPVLNETPKIPIFSYLLSTREFNKNPEKFYTKIYNDCFRIDPSNIFPIDTTINIFCKDNIIGYWNNRNENSQRIFEDFETIGDSSLYEQCSNNTGIFKNYALYFLYNKYHSDFKTCKFHEIRKCLENSKTFDEFKVNCVLNGIELVV